MPAQQMQAEQFRSYPPQAKQIATGNIPLLQQLPWHSCPCSCERLSFTTGSFPRNEMRSTGSSVILRV